MFYLKTSMITHPRRKDIWEKYAPYGATCSVFRKLPEILSEISQIYYHAEIYSYDITEIDVKIDDSKTAKTDIRGDGDDSAWKYSYQLIISSTDRSILEHLINIRNFRSILFTGNPSPEEIINRIVEK